jgi:hypothetical protein
MICQLLKRKIKLCVCKYFIIIYGIIVNFILDIVGFAYKMKDCS